MRPIHVAQLDKSRPVLILTRETGPPPPEPGHGRPGHQHHPWPVHRGVGRTGQRPRDDSVVCSDKIVTVPTATLGRLVGYLLPRQEAELAEAIRTAFDLV